MSGDYGSGHVRRSLAGIAEQKQATENRSWERDGRSWMALSFVAVLLYCCRSSSVVIQPAQSEAAPVIPVELILHTVRIKG